jgi:hypothetical protein
MDKKQILDEMKTMIGNKDPILFFEKMTSLFEALSNQMDSLEKSLDKVKTNSALAIAWDPKVANDLLSHQIDVLRADKELYHEQLSEVKKAYVQGIVTQDYNTFVNFWLDTLGYHPFLNYKK